ncbi:hypothetical protein STPH2_3856 [Streptomyces sp. KO7888]|nr:hypothetical protein [Streptomyces sp. KO7888]
MSPAGPSPSPRPHRLVRLSCPLFEYLRGYGRPPQIRPVFSVHTLGTGKLSRSCPQARLVRDHQGRSAPCGFVDERSPQAVDEEMIHRLCIQLSTGNPQAGGSCPQRSPASPHACPLFGNATRPVTASSERRHTRLPGWAVGNVGKAGDGAGEKSPLPVHGVCRTFCSPQTGPVVHRLRPQGPWTKFVL